VLEKRREIDERLDSIMNAGNGREPFPLSFSLEWETFHEFLPHELAYDDELNY
jgi:hypothetical protein